MAVYLNTNIVSLNSRRNLELSQNAVTVALQRLSSGLRINSAKDDAAGMSIVTRMTAQINGMNQAARNANDAISLLQTAEGGISAITDSLQRIRDLSVQAANGSYSISDRRVINNEARQLLDEIQRVAISTRFNDINLLDGNFNAQSFQVGANQGEVINIDFIKNMQTAQLGSSGSLFMASVTGSAVTALLNAGDLTLNGVPVGASQAAANSGQSSSSAFAIATAINSVTNNSSVTATAKTTLLSLSAPSLLAPVADFTINGINVGAVAAGNNAAAQGANLAAAITSISAQSGIAAEANASGVLTLTAADGRDINISLAGTAASAAVATANRNAFLAQTGLAGSVVGTQASVATAAQNTLNLNTNISAGAVFTINGINFTVVNSASATAVVDSTHVNLNISGATNSAATVSAALSGALVSAQANPLTASALNGITVADGGGSVTINDITAGASSTSISSSAATVVQNIRGVAAVASSAARTQGSVSLISSSIDGLNIGGKAPENAGLTAGVTLATEVSRITGINSLNVLNAVSARNAISSIDSALDMANTARAALGAYQNRFISAVTNLQISVENLSISRSRIQDTDFASETSALTRSQILQQAGMAMLAQANSIPNRVLALLK